jgi:hypothetical protein
MQTKYRKKEFAKVLEQHEMEKGQVSTELSGDVKGLYTNDLLSGRHCGT